MNGKDKARLLGLFFWLFTGFNILIVGVFAVIYISIFGFVIAQAPQKASDPPPELIMTIIVVAFAFALLSIVFFSIPKIVAGYGLRKEKSWARIWAMIASIMACMSFPIGTAIGVFGLVFIFSEDGKRYFAEIENSRGQLVTGPAATPPPTNSWQ